MAKQRTILEDPRFPKFAARYRNDILKFVVEAIGDKPSWQQRVVLDAVSPKGEWVSIASGHGTGKSHMMAWIVLHFMLCHVKPNVVLTANNIQQVRDVVFKYVKESWDKLCRRFPWLEPYFIVTSERFYARGLQKQWFTAGRTVPKDKPESIAGFHNRNYLVIVDEASGVDDRVLGVLRGALSEENNKLILLSQPTRNSGHFYDSHHTLTKDPSDPNSVGYRAIVLNSEESPFVTLKAIRQYAKSYGGYDSPEYQIKVRGQFSDQLEGFLISRRLVEMARGTTVQHTGQWGYVLVADIGGGVERDSSVVGLFKVSGFDPLGDRVVEPVWVREMPKTMSARDVGRELYQFAQEYSNVVVVIDSVGIGLTAAQEAEELGCNVQRMMWGIPCHAEAQKRRFLNQRALAWVALRDGLLEERVRVDGSDQAINQISRIPYKLDERGRYVMKSKDEMRSEGIKSPDWGDVYAMAMLADFIPQDDRQASSGEAIEQDEHLSELLRLAQE